jgi:hypothetical protein
MGVPKTVLLYFACGPGPQMQEFSEAERTLTSPKSSLLRFGHANRTAS